MPYPRWQRLLSVVASAGLLVGTFAPALAAPRPDVTPPSDAPASTPAATEAAYSHRLIIELESPSLAVWANTQTQSHAPEAASLWNSEGLLNVKAPAAQAYVNQLKAEQAAFINTLHTALPTASVDYLIDEAGQQRTETYQVVFNGLTIDPGTDQQAAMRQLLTLPGVKQVYFDYAHQSDLYTSTALINAPALWNALGGRNNAGAGIRLASMDGGAHHSAPMFNGAGYSYPPNWPVGGLGDTANNNGKIIASRVYFRSWDPPSPGDENSWPGTQGTSHGVHTASTAAGNVVTNAVYNTVPLPTMSGVAPKAWVMSYRVFYNSVTNNGSFYNAEGIAALEDIATDGAQVLNNSWGGGPSSTGGLGDALDVALMNTAASGVFVSMSNGNSGPGLGTGDHPSPDYINVAASTTSGTYAAGLASVSAPTPVSATLQNWGFGTASFGQPLLIGQVYTYTYLPGEVISPTNFEGCTPWPAGTFTGKTALIRRGSCEFGVKALNAQNAGAASVIIYNQASNGNTLITMGPGAVGASVTIPAILVGNTLGTGAVTWYNTYTDTSRFTVSTIPFQAGNTPDYIASFSSRGPGMGNVLKPDVAAPGVNIMAQGYTDNATGEARHLGYGQASGTSMASPHVAGSAALLRQLYPTWSNAAIKSALMSTAKYWFIYRQEDGKAAQPLDMGAGRIDLAAAMDPGVILNPPSLGYGLVPTNTGTYEMSYWVTNITTRTEMYTLTTLYTGAGYTATTALPGFSVSPSMLTLAAGAGATVTVTFDPMTSMGYGDNQGYIVMDGDWHDAHLPVWARVTPDTAPADVLIIDNDGSFTLGHASYINTYTATLAALGYSYTIYDADANFGTGKRTTIPDLATLSGYKAILYYTGDNYRPNGTFVQTTPLSDEDMYRLNEYATNGGTLLAMGQDLAGVTSSNDTSPHFFYGTTLGAKYLRDSVSANVLPTYNIVPAGTQPSAFASLNLDVSGPTTWSASGLVLSGANEVPAVASPMSGLVTATYDVATRYLDLNITLTSTVPMTLTAGHIHSGTVGTNGPVQYTLLSTTMTDTTSYSQRIVTQLSAANATRLTTGRLYVNFHTDVNPGGEVRAQLVLAPNKDGAANQAFIDEIRSNGDVFPGGPASVDYMPVLRYGGAGAMEDNYVSMAHRDQPTLEEPDLAFWGAAFYTSFGLEGVNGATSRQALLQKMFNWAWDRPTVTISNTTIANSNGENSFKANYVSNIAGATPVSYRWDFGDGSAYEDTGISPNAGHDYALPGTYTVRVEVVDSYGNHTIGWTTVTIAGYKLYLPFVRNEYPIVVPLNK